jgi:hypothetical protein
MLADGGEAISDLAVLPDQPEVFGPVASTATGAHPQPDQRLRQRRRYPARIGDVASNLFVTASAASFPASSTAVTLSV